MKCAGCGSLEWECYRCAERVGPEDMAYVLSVERLRAVIREIPAIDWTKSDDLTRYARAVQDGLLEVAK